MSITLPGQAGRCPSLAACTALLPPPHRPVSLPDAVVAHDVQDAHADLVAVAAAAGQSRHCAACEQAAEHVLRAAGLDGEATADEAQVCWPEVGPSLDEVPVAAGALSATHGQAPSCSSKNGSELGA